MTNVEITTHQQLNSFEHKIETAFHARETSLTIRGGVFGPYPGSPEKRVYFALEQKASHWDQDQRNRETTIFLNQTDAAALFAKLGKLLKMAKS